MKNKYIFISIMLSITAFVGVALLGATNARADWDRTCTAPTTTMPGECLTIGTDQYTIKAFVGCNNCADLADCNLSTCEEKDVNPGIGPGTNWPIIEGGYAIFRYITGVTVPGTKPSSQSYTVFDWPVVPSLGGSPNGAQQDKDTVWSDCNADIARIAWMLNRVANQKKDGIIDIYMPMGTNYDDTCGQVFIKWGGLCEGGPIWVAENAANVVPSLYSGCGWEVRVIRNQCTGIPTDVKCYFDDELIGSAVQTLDGVICTSDTGAATDCFEVDPSVSPIVICTDSAPIFAYDEVLYFCPELTSP